MQDQGDVEMDDADEDSQFDQSLQPPQKRGNLRRKRAKMEEEYSEGEEEERSSSVQAAEN